MKRRTLLSKTAKSAVIGIGVTSAATTSAVAESGVDSKTVRRELGRHNGVLQELVDAGHLDHPGVAQFDLETDAAPGAAEKGVSKTEAENPGTGETTAVYTINHEVDDGFVHIRIMPDIDFASATHRTDEGDTVYGDARSEEDDGVSTQCHKPCGTCYVTRCRYPCFTSDDPCADCCWCARDCNRVCRPC